MLELFFGIIVVTIITLVIWHTKKKKNYGQTVETDKKYEALKHEHEQLQKKYDNLRRTATMELPYGVTRFSFEGTLISSDLFKERIESDMYSISFKERNRYNGQIDYIIYHALEAELKRLIADENRTFGYQKYELMLEEVKQPIHQPISDDLFSAFFDLDLLYRNEKVTPMRPNGYSITTNLKLFYLMKEHYWAAQYDYSNAVNVLENHHLDFLSETMHKLFINDLKRLLTKYVKSQYNETEDVIQIAQTLMQMKVITYYELEDLCKIYGDPVAFTTKTRRVDKETFETVYDKNNGELIERKYGKTKEDETLTDREKTEMERYRNTARKNQLTRSDEELKDLVEKEKKLLKTKVETIEKYSPTRELVELPPIPEETPATEKDVPIEPEKARTVGILNIDKF